MGAEGLVQGKHISIADHDPELMGRDAILYAKLKISAAVLADQYVAGKKGWFSPGSTLHRYPGRGVLNDRPNISVLECKISPIIDRRGYSSIDSFVTAKVPFTEDHIQVDYFGGVRAGESFLSVELGFVAHFHAPAILERIYPTRLTVFFDRQNGLSISYFPDQSKKNSVRKITFTGSAFNSEDLFRFTNKGFTLPKQIPSYIELSLLSAVAQGSDKAIHHLIDTILSKNEPFTQVANAQEFQTVLAGVLSKA